MDDSPRPVEAGMMKVLAPYVGVIPTDILIEIAAALTRAIREERTACAMIADALCDPLNEASGPITAGRIAVEIRARP